MRKAKNGDTVRLHFTGCFDDGTTFATTVGEKPLELTVGDGKLIEGFEKCVIGMAEGEEKRVRLEPEQAAGPQRPELVKTVSRHTIPEQHEDLKVGSKLLIKTDDGEMVEATVKQLSDQEVTLDANKPLAGKALTFDIELIKFT